MDEQSQTVSIKEAAAIMDVTALTVRRWIKSGRLRSQSTKGACKIVREHKIKRSDIDALMSEGNNGSQG